jgi:palmitoyltransferase
MGSHPGTWIAALALSTVFCIFATTMSCTTGYNLAINYTSVEAIQRGGITHIAFRITHLPTGPAAIPTPTSTPPTSSPKKEHDTPAESDDNWPVVGIFHRPGGATVVVMHTNPFQHPWSSSLMNGWKDTMGTSFVDWILPLKYSPCVQKTRRGEFRWGEVVYDMARKYEKEHPGARLAVLE